MTDRDLFPGPIVDRLKAATAAAASKDEAIAVLRRVVVDLLNEWQVNEIAKPCSLSPRGFCLVHDMGPCLIGEARAALAATAWCEAPAPAGHDTEGPKEP